MPSSNTCTCLPRLFLYSVGNTTLNIPNHTLFLSLIQNFTQDHSFLTAIFFQTLIVCMCCNTRSYIIYRIKREYRIIKIDQIRIIFVNSIYGSVINIIAIFFRRLRCPVSPIPLFMNIADIITSYTSRMILSI